jgi:hypothetical protein
MTIGWQFAIKFTAWRGYTSGGLRITSRTIPGVGTESGQLTHVKSRVIGAQDESWSVGDIIAYKNLISTPDSSQTSIIRSHHVGKNPYEDSNPYCSIEVRFKGNVSRGTPRFSTGPNHSRLGEFTGNIKIEGNTWSVYGFRFEVVGSVNSGGIGRIGDASASTSIRLGNGQWTIGQWKYPFPSNQRNGVARSDLGRTTDDSPRYPRGPDQNVSVRGRNFNWNDEPGFSSPPDDPLRSGSQTTNFIVYAQNGDKRCAVAFHIDGSFENGTWHGRIGPGLLP